MGSVRVDVSASVSNLIEETPDIAKQSILASVMEGKDIAGSLMTDIRASSKTQFKRMRKYAARHFYYGLPTSSVPTNSTRGDDNLVQYAIETDIGEPVKVYNSYIQQDIIVDFIEYVLYAEGIRHNNRVITYPAEDVGIVPIDGKEVRYSYGFVVGNGDFDIWYEIDSYGPYSNNEKRTYSGHDIYSGEPYYFGFYRTKAELEGVSDESTIPMRHWLYRISTNKHAILKPKRDDIEVGNPFYPIIPIRLNNTDMTDDSRIGTVQYDSSAKVLDKIGLDFKELGLAIHGDPSLTYPAGTLQAFVTTNYPNISTGFYVEEYSTETYELETYTTTNIDELPTNYLLVDYYDTSYDKQYREWGNVNRPLAKEKGEYEASESKQQDVADIDHAFVTFGIGILEDDTPCLNYLFEFFKYYERRQYFNKNDFLLFEQNRNTGNNARLAAPRQNEVDLVEANQYNTSLTYYYIEVINHKNMVIGDKGKVTRQIIIRPPGKYNDPGFVGGALGGIRDERSEVRLKKQVKTLEKDGENLVEEVVIFGLFFLNKLYQKDGFVFVSLEDAQNDENKASQFLVPLHAYVVDNIPLFQEIELYYFSCKMMVQTIVVTKLKWYQKANFLKFFKALMIVVSVIVFIYTGINLYVAFVKGTLASTLATQIGTAIVADLAFDFIVDQLGPKAALFVAAVLATVNFTATTNATFAKTIKDMLPAADHFLRIGNLSLSSVQKAIDSDLKELMKEATDWAEEAQEQMNELDDMWEELERDTYIDPYWFIDSATMWNPTESPTQFFRRTVHEGNIGINAVDTVHNYVDTMLRLPTLKETILS